MLLLYGCRRRLARGRGGRTLLRFLVELLIVSLGSEFCNVYRLHLDNFRLPAAAPRAREERWASERGLGGASVTPNTRWVSIETRLS